MSNPLSRLDPGTIADRLRAIGNAWADAQAAASHLEEATKPLHAQLTLRGMGRGISKAQAELEALASEDYRRHVASVVDAKLAANKAKVYYDSAKTWAELTRTEHANRRAEMQHLGG